MTRFLSLVRRDVVLAFRQGSASTMVVMFFVLTVTLFPLGVGPETNILERMSSGVLWVAVAFGIPTYTGIDVGVVNARRTDFNEDFRSPGHWHGHVSPIDQRLWAAVRGERHGTHRLVL